MSGNQAFAVSTPPRAPEPPSAFCTRTSLGQWEQMRRNDLMHIEAVLWSMRSTSIICNCLQQSASASEAFCSRYESYSFHCKKKKKYSLIINACTSSWEMTKNVYFACEQNLSLRITFEKITLKKIKNKYMSYTFPVLQQALILLEWTGFHRVTRSSLSAVACATFLMWMEESLNNCVVLLLP